MIPASPAGEAVRDAFLADEHSTLVALASQIAQDDGAERAVTRKARAWVESVRVDRQSHGGIESFLQQYDLSTPEGVLLMCIAEALLRIPDAATADALIRDKLARGDWERHLGASDSLLVNASTWGLMLTGRITRIDRADARDPRAWYERFVARAGEPVVRVAVRQAMKVMAEQFVLGRTIEEAVANSDAQWRHSYDMLGEAAVTAADAARYFDSYRHAIATIGTNERRTTANEAASADASPSISVKLSALHPRYEYPQRGRVLAELVPVVISLAHAARDARIGMTIDAEEAERLELSLEVFARVRRDPALADWHGLGLAVQAYQKRARAVVGFVVGLARDSGTRIPVRLVKGAYWDTEIKRAQVQGLAGYPVFTRKPHTDICYLACAKALLDAGDAVYPMFATHNAHTIAWVSEQAARQRVRAYEFQRLFGMGEALYRHVLARDRGQSRNDSRTPIDYGSDPDPAVACRIYAPVGGHRDLLPYLVRRLLENGANTSFVNRIGDPRIAIDDVIADPLARARHRDFAPAPNIPLPVDLFAPERRNSESVSLADQQAMRALDEAVAQSPSEHWTAAPTLGEATPAAREAFAPAEAKPAAREAFAPADRKTCIGAVTDADETDVDRTLALLVGAQPAWDARGALERAAILDRAAAGIEAQRGLWVAMLAREAGKTRSAAIAEVREAADFCRYYAAQARARFASPTALPSPTGESNTLALHGRGVFACISPWNFPLAIFTGQIAAALAAGNAAVAKPAEQTPLIAAQAVRTLHESGVPPDVLALLPGPGETIGARLVADRRVAGVAFTGSTSAGSAIAQSLAARAPIVPLIAETGGQNAMIVDSSSLAEQVVADIVQSAFDSAGQRCSALRLLCLQEDIAPRVLELLEGAMDELVIGDPGELATDVGPVIDEAARDALETHIAAMDSLGLVRHRVALPETCGNGTFVAPTLIALDRMDRLTQEVFGPVVHVATWRASELDSLVDAINGFGYGLTLGIHSRVDATIERIVSRVRVGNVYVNRNMIGAVVGMQPFGGEGLSGTGPKAGGPNYLPRFAVERTLSVNTAAAGGNAALLAQDEA
ncbi:MAG TPA: bifunctional proline dehydrogenase/L-glutamate gamma-semialdehyde dehydrogenase PutA [Casimicrobiaceae bacterium]|nr:bifunctional proline dehydrogenase/L-glutamate gamma-semialdehyde dehydrogenase PutA [Casimicrobiaceae bacterium]